MPIVPSVGNVQTPAGFTIQSAERAVLLSWNRAPLATIYYINRSTDGITFVNLDSTTSLSYSDTTGVLETIYYYQIQAGNGTASSVATQSLQGRSLTPGKTTLGNIRLECQQRSDLVNSTNITTQEWNTMISKSYKELYDIIIQKFGDDYYFADPYVFSTVSNQSFYDLPPDFYKLLGVEVNCGGNWATLKQFQFIQRNFYQDPGFYAMYGKTNMRYRIEGNSIYIVPLPSEGQQVRMWFAPRPNQLIYDTDLVDGVSGWEEYIVTDCCIKALAKQEQDPSIFLAQKNSLLKRIEEAAENRNIGEPERISDSKSVNFDWSGGSGWDSSNGGW